jgi:hypothetical protein
MQRTRLLFILATLVFLFASGFGINFKDVSRDELKMTSEPQAAGASAIILFRQVDRDDSAAMSQEENYVRIKILKEEGRKHADIEIPFDSDEVHIRNLHARSIRPDGTVANFEGKPVTRTIVKAKGVKYKAQTIALPDVQVGSVIEYYYQVEFPEGALFNSNWEVSQDLFTRRAKFTLVAYTEGELNLRFVWHGLPNGLKPKLVGSSRVEMEVENIPAFETENYMPPKAEEEGRVEFIYEQSSLPKEKDKYWKEIGRRWNDSMEEFVGKRKAMEQAVSEIIAPGDSSEVKLQKIYARVQAMRNTSFEEEKTEAEKKREKDKTPGNVENVWKSGSGTGANLTWLFLGLVRAAGFEASGCWVAPRSYYFFSQGTMQKNRLFENVAIVKVDGKERYFDPGAAFTPFGMLPWSETGVTGLRLDKQGGSWLQTPPPESKDSQIRHKAELRLGEDGELTGKLTVTYTGLDAAYVRVEERHEDAVARKKYLEDAVKGDVPVGVEVELTNSPEWKRSDVPLVAEFTLKVPGWGAGTGKRMIFPMGLFSAGEKRVFDNAKRVHAIYRHYPSEQVDEIKVELPEGWTVKSVPEPAKAIYPIISYESNAGGEGGKLHISRKLGVNFILLPLDAYAPLRQFYEQVKDADEEQVLLQPAPLGAR